MKFVYFWLETLTKLFLALTRKDYSEWEAGDWKREWYPFPTADSKLILSSIRNYVVRCYGCESLTLNMTERPHSGSSPSSHADQRNFCRGCISRTITTVRTRHETRRVSNLRQVRRVQHATSFELSVVPGTMVCSVNPHIDTSPTKGPIFGTSLWLLCLCK
jgi:hypothetical protein